MKRTIRIILITVLTFSITYYLQRLHFGSIRSWINSVVESIGISHFLTYLIIGIPLFVGVGLIHGLRKIPESVGLAGSISRGFLFALVCTLPMLIGYALIFDFNSDITFLQIFTGAIVAGFIEELFYRGVLFGQIYRYTKIGFIPSIVLGALVFAMGHLYQSQDPATLMGVFITTFMGAILFAWVYVEWKFNLWVPIFLHILMNLFWMLFSVSDNAFGGGYANIFRMITIAMVIVFTVVPKVRRGQKVEINRKTLLMKDHQGSSTK